MDSAKKAADQSEGALRQLEQTLRAEFKCDTMSDAKELLTTLEEELAEQEEAYLNAEKAFSKKYGDKLN
jgi:hypothetical protein